MTSNDHVMQTMCLAVFLGIAGQYVAKKLRIPALIPMVVLGIVAGPRFLHLLHTDALLHLTTALIAVGVAVILFEGGMTLNVKDLRGASRATLNLILVGPFITTAGAAACFHYAIGLDWRLALLSGAILSVSGPTVVAALMEHANVKKRLRDILTWEAIIVEAVGGILMVVVLQFIVSEADTQLKTFLYFLKKMGIGAVAGLLTGKALTLLIRRRVLGHELLNLGVLAVLFSVFWLTNHVAHESGLLAMAIAGLMVGQLKHPALEEVRAFKEQLSLLILSVIFILIAANIDLGNLSAHGWRTVPAVAGVLFVVRPLMVFVTTAGSGLSLGEKLFLAWTAPRGVIALAMASLFTIILTEHHLPGAASVESLVFIVIVTTVTLTGLGTLPVARLLGVTAPPRNGYLIVGVHPFSLAVAGLLRDAGLPVRLVDNRDDHLEAAAAAGLSAACCNIMDEEELEKLGLERMGTMLALTENDETNTLVCRLGRRLFGDERAYQIVNTFLSDITDEVLLSFKGRPAFDMKMSVAMLNERLRAGQLRVERLELPRDGRKYRTPDSFLSALFFLYPGRAVVAQEDDRIPVAAVIALTMGM